MSRTLAGMNVLVVDDNKFIVGLLQRYLEKLGVTAPLHAPDGMSPLDQVDSAPVDLVLCDLSMPGMDGIEFLRHLAEREMPPAVIMLSGHATGLLTTAVTLRSEQERKTDESGK